MNDKFIKDITIRTSIMLYNDSLIGDLIEIVIQHYGCTDNDIVYKFIVHSLFILKS